MKKRDKIKLKKYFKAFMLLKFAFTFYVVVSFLIVPGITSIDAKTISGAHRGASVEYEENTMGAFERALEDEKYVFVEFDIQYSKDKEIVVFHENNMFRMSKTSLSISELTYDELNSEFEFEIPKYKEVMDLLAGEKALNIELKSQGNFEDDKEIVDFVIADCKERGILDQIMISSISADVVEYIEIEYPEIISGKIYWVTLSSMIPIEFICNDVYETSADYVLLHGYNLHNYASLVNCKPEDKGLIFWYFTDEEYIINDGQNIEFWNNC